MAIFKPDVHCLAPVFWAANVFSISAARLRGFERNRLRGLFHATSSASGHCPVGCTETANGPMLNHLNLWKWSLLLVALLGFLRSPLAAENAPETTPAGEKLYSMDYTVSRQFPADVAADNQKRKTDLKGYAVVAYLEDRGVQFPKGATAFLIQGRIIVRNTAENILRIEALVDDDLRKYGFSPTINRRFKKLFPYAAPAPAPAVAAPAYEPIAEARARETPAPTPAPVEYMGMPLSEWMESVVVAHNRAPVNALQSGDGAFVEAIEAIAARYRDKPGEAYRAGG